MCFNADMDDHNRTTNIPYKFIADLVFLVHLALVGAVALGWLIPGFFYIHLALLLATLFSEMFLGYCPLTRLEFGLRKKLDPTLSFDKSCMVHYLRKWRGLVPRPAISSQASFFKKHTFIFVLLALGILSFVYRFYIVN